MERKTLITITTFTIVIIFVVIAFLKKPSTSVTFIPQVATDVSQQNSFDDELINKSILNSKVFDVNPFPKRSISNENCEAIQREIYAASTDNFKKDMDKVAIDYSLGQSKEEIADAIWFKYSWQHANRWYETAANYEAIARHLLALQSLGIGKDETALVERYNSQALEEGTLIHYSTFSIRTENLWKEIPLKHIGNLLLSEAPDHVILAEINEGLANIPEALMADRRLSPLIELLPSLVNLERY